MLNQNDADALAAAATAAGLVPTQTFGNVSNATTIVGTSGLYVIKINGNITKMLTLSGTSTSIFVVNVTGTVTLDGSDTMGLSGGVTANHGAVQLHRRQR